MNLFRYGTQVCGSLADGAGREWLVADGRGGYAMGTAAGLRTRRYHGLLIVAASERPRRMMALASLDPVLELGSGTRIRLATHEWGSGAVDPPGHELLESFEVRDGLPLWRWRVGEVVLERTLAMRHGHPSVAVVHTLRAGGPVRLILEPLCTWRDAHGERYAAGGDPLVEPTADGIVVEGSYRVAGPGFEPDGAWYHGVHHREEAARGLNPVEDLFRPGRFVATVDTGGSVAVSAWAGPLEEPPPPAPEVVAAARRRAAALYPADADPVTRALVLAADAFIIAGSGGGPASDGVEAGGTDVVAGYPWFGAWSRDTMIAYEGLFLATGRAAEGRELLRGYAGRLSGGMLANTADTGRTEYNTADATLWFLHAVGRHVAATGDLDLAAELAAPFDEVVRAHTAGTRFGIRIDPADGLLTQGTDGYALTWMDAIVDGRPVTPRRGKAVELNALWINGLHTAADLRERLGRDATALRDAAARATESFRRRFPAPGGWLHDVIDPADASLRPNQLLAYGLPHAPMRGGDPGPVRHVARSLLTPLGVRTLAPDDPAYRGVHRGDPAGRDGAYHQGTVWPWLIGPYVDAARTIGGADHHTTVGGADHHGTVGLGADDVLNGLTAHLPEWGVGSVSETADGDTPHTATGCPFQAWSVAELLRVVRPIGTGSAGFW